MRYFHELARKVEIDAKQSELIQLLESYLDKFNSKLSLLHILWNKLNGGGLYIWGDVGTGKSLMLEHFYGHLQQPKLKFHLHEFMEKLHNQLHNIRTSENIEGRNLIKQAVADILSSARVLCLDEFEVHDIASAMMLERVLEEINNRGVFIVITSNSHPDKLYYKGLKRDNFIACINYIKNNYQIFNLDNNIDYRGYKDWGARQRYFYPLSDQNAGALKEWRNNLAGDNEPSTAQIELYGRKVEFNSARGEVLITDFRELCQRELSSLDYKRICAKFSYIILDNLPAAANMSKDSRKRFIHFIDTAYIYNILVIIRAESSLNELIEGYEDLSEMARCQSRLVEMQSLEYFS
jgi:cell division protein ZapE